MSSAPDRRRSEAPVPLTSQERGRMARAAALRPLNLLVLAVGVVFFVSTAFAWWALPLTLATYAALVFLGIRDPILQHRVLGRKASPALQAQDLSPERRARWVPRGEAREKVEAALVEYRKVVAAIEESDDVTRAVLADTLPRLHAAADRLVDAALSREKAAGTVRDLRAHPQSGTGDRGENLRRLENGIASADGEISATFQEMLDLRAKVVRISIDTDNARRARDLNASLDSLNARLEALDDITAPPEDRAREG